MPKKKRPTTADYMREQAILSEERTILSKERTILAFMQTGLAFIGVGLVIVNLLANVGSQIVGWVLIIFGFFETLESYRRLKKYMKEMEKIKKSVGKTAI